jgi:hypothetical protein
MSDVQKKQVNGEQQNVANGSEPLDIPKQSELKARSNASFPGQEPVALASNLRLPNGLQGYGDFMARFPGHAPQLGGEAVHFAPVSGQPIQPSNINSQVSQGIYSPVTFPSYNNGGNSVFTPSPNHFTSSARSGSLFTPSAFDQKVGDFIKALFKLLLAPFIPKSRREPRFVKQARRRR